MTTSNEAIFSKTLIIHAPAKTVWDALTVPALMQQWMSETPIEIITDWTIGKPIMIKGMHYKMPFENKGIVLEYVPNKLLTYSHLASISRLEDRVENYSILEFKLMTEGGTTSLSFRTYNSPDDVIHKHLAFYWNVTLEIIKKQVEAYYKNNSVR